MATTGSVVGSLQVNIVATTDKFIAGLNKASTMMGRFVAKTGSIGNSVTSLFTSANIFWGLVTAAVGKLLDASIQAGESVYALTKKLHISAEAVSALHFAADRLGTSIEAVDMGIARMGMTLGKAINGSNEAAIAFGELGLNIKELTTLPVEQQFLAVVKALHAVTDTNKRAAIAQAIFSRGAKDLAGLIEQGTDAIVGQGDAAARLGAIMGTDVADGLHKASNALKDAGSSWGEFKNEFVAASEPVIEWVSWLSTKALQGIQVVFYGIRTAILDTLAVTVNAVSLIAKALNTVLPKSLKINTDAIDSYRDQFSKESNKQWGFTESKASQFLGNGGTQKNPLQAPATNAPTDISRAADSMEQLVAEMKRINNERADQQKASPAPMAPIVIAGAGVR